MSRLLALALSAVFHPLLVPLYLFYVVCYQLPGVVAQPVLAGRGAVMALVAAGTLALPGLGTALLVRLGYADSVELQQRHQRTGPLLLAVVGFTATSFLLYQPGRFDALLCWLMAGMTLAVLLTLLITLRWKISAHGVGMGGALGLLLLLNFGGAAGAAGLWWLAGCAMVAAAVSRARLVLDAHTPAQVWAGLALGLGLGVALAIGAVAGL
ncbi:hypothetical protein [Hymenobacter aerophilus]|uniref:hypothetical protein n=1 Tax=Hymenobacter aerophilus TaxID=119644 RepID=UPI0005270D79|nr:hypothetical protein [Hymenobacter aerophilus]